MAVKPQADGDAVSQFVLGKPLGELDHVERMTIKTSCDTANELVRQYVGTDPVPAALCKAAILRLAFFDYWTQHGRRQGDGGGVSLPQRRDMGLSPLRASGAAAILSPFKRRRAAPCEAGQ